MAYTRQEVQDWVKKLNLNTWGPTEVYWSDQLHRVHVIAADAESEAITAKIHAAVEAEIAAGTTDETDARDFLERLIVTDYAQED
ncbi:hypothetical protein [Weissella cibaria]|uniref:hypothetical protein n=1 Tax=Weissella cibaria TaxID=137591 RepID=UPI001FA70C19|nr:hypothetical protein [Weissella cibaria]UNW40227.1 hypothetical protein HUW87_08215 [Weissella cibaria]